ncbi:MAG: hypothetical protein ACOC9N_03390, partial [Gemmatimonadota bacterium]
MPVIGALGTIVLDRIHPPPREAAGEPRKDDGPLEDWGGLTYALEALEVACEEGWSFLPLAKVGEDVFEAASRRVASLTGVSGLEGLRRVPEPNNRVELRYHDAGDRCERLEGGVPGWSWEELAPLAARCDALYLNFIAGWELDLDAARALRRHFEGPIYCDVHSLLLGVDTSGVRVRRALPDPDDWIACFDWIQGNEPEIALLTERGDPLEGVRALVGKGARAAFCTLGVKGAAWATPDGAGRAAAPAAPSAAGSRPDPT